MFVYIAHAEADQAAADDLKSFLKSRGLVVETETGARGFRHLQKSDVVIALWSQKSVFGVQRMQMEKRMLDAWADGRLVLVKLDHGFLPVGMRDLPAIDASFESARKLSVWPQVERAAREAINDALVAAQKPEAPPGGATGGAPGGGPAPAPSAKTAPPDRAAPAPPQREAFASRRGPTWTGPVLLLGFLLAAAAGVLLFVPTLASDTVRWSVFAAAGAWLLVMILVIAVVTRAPPKAKRAPARPARAGATAAPESEATADDVLAAPAAATVFISYAHADDASVQPVVDVVKNTGRKVWIDKGGIAPGEGWAGEIVRGIKGSTGIMIMCSPNAFESDHIKREVYLADRYKKPMLPVFIAAANLPEDFEFFFAGVQWLELFKLPEAERPEAISRALASV